MVLLIPLALSAFGARFIAWAVRRRGVRALDAWDSWPAAAGIGMAVVYACTSVTHFVEPQRGGLVAIVPPWVPAPDAVVTLSGVAEILLAVALVVPRTRRLAGIASALFLLVVLPANVVAAAGVDHPAAPSTPLLVRLPLQIVFIAISFAAVLPPQGRSAARTAR